MTLDDSFIEWLPNIRKLIIYNIHSKDDFSWLIAILQRLNKFLIETKNNIVSLKRNSFDRLKCCKILINVKRHLPKNHILLDPFHFTCSNSSSLSTKISDISIDALYSYNMNESEVNGLICYDSFSKVYKCNKCKISIGERKTSSGNNNLELWIESLENIFILDVICNLMNYVQKNFSIHQICVNDSLNLRLISSDLQRCKKSEKNLMRYFIISLEEKSEIDAFSFNIHNLRFLELLKSIKEERIQTNERYGSFLILPFKEILGLS